ncbi:MAG TPA: head GIN domain-containing protein [Sphingomicrobium sp.]|nr:head GIN domain-containing protein [Sphingomicrobium sp.]
MMRKSIVVAVIAACSATSACGRMHDEGAGPSVSRSYQVGNFQQIEVAGPYQVNVRTGANPAVSGEGSEKLLDRTVVVVEGDKLVIRPQENHGWFHFGWSSGKATFAVTVPKLNAATIAGSGDIRVDHVQGDRFDGAVAGSGGLSVDSVNVGALKLSIGGSGSAKAGSGKAQTADYGIGGSGDIEAGAVETQQAKVSIAGSGSVKARATSTADVSIMGSGDVDVAGGAKCSISKAGSGSVRCS